MNKTFLIFTFLLSMAAISTAQKGTTELNVGPEAGIPTGDFAGDKNGGFRVGFGGTLKALFGVGRTDQITATSGYSSFSAKGLPANIRTSIRIIPVLVGYRHNINGFYLEPQVGMGRYKAKVTMGGARGSNSEIKLTWAAGVGYLTKAIDFGVRHQASRLDGGTVSFVAFRVAFNY